MTELVLAKGRSLDRPRARWREEDEHDPVSIEATADRAAWIGLATVVVFFVFFGGWAALSNLDSAVSATGVVEVSGSRKVVEHADGGIVSAILIKNGDRVAQGQELLRLDQTQVRAALDIQTSQVDTFTAIAARLEAERDGRGAIDFPRALLDRVADPKVASILSTQRALFQARQAELSGQSAILSQQVAQARSQVSGMQNQVTALAAQEGLVRDELAGMQQLFEKGYATRTRLLALQRAAAALEGQKGEYAGNLARLGYTVGQLEQQVAQVRRQRSAEATRELEEVLAKLADARDRQIATRDVLNRTVIRAPVAGHVLGLNVNTIGAVVERGETLFEVVPTGSAPMIEVRLAPDDGQLAEDGMKAQVRFLSNKSRRLKPVWGKVTNRSVDLLADERTGEQFYTLQVTIDPLEAAKLPAGTLSPGAPVEVVVPTGSRTALQYLLDPIRQTFSHGMREH